MKRAIVGESRSTFERIHFTPREKLASAGQLAQNNVSGALNRRCNKGNENIRRIVARNQYAVPIYRNNEFTRSRFPSVKIFPANPDDIFHAVVARSFVMLAPFVGTQLHYPRDVVRAIVAWVIESIKKKKKEQNKNTFDEKYSI